MKRTLMIVLTTFTFLSCTKEIFEENVYYQSTENNRSMYVYTNIKDPKKLIEYGRKQINTKGKETIVHFFSTRENTHPFTSVNGHDYSMWLTDAEKKYTNYMIGTYYKGAKGEEKWFNKSDATIDKSKYKVIN